MTPAPTVEDLIAAAIDRKWAAREPSFAKLVAAEVIAALTAHADSPRFLSTRDAARAAGFPSAAALRMAARRHVDLASARLSDGRRWDRAKLLAAVADGAAGRPTLRVVGAVK